MEASTTVADNVLSEAIANAVRKAADAGAYGVLLAGLPNLRVFDILDRLKDSNAHVSLVGVENDAMLAEAAKSRGWDPHRLGIGAAHAVHIRNAAPADSLKVVFVGREDSAKRLHSLTRRGYASVGPDEVVEQICLSGAGKAENQPQRDLWAALGSEEVRSFLSLEQVLDYYGALYGAPATEQQDTPRHQLPLLGLLPDPLLLTAKYSRKPDIVRRILDNVGVVERLQRADEEDRKNAVQTVESAGDRRPDLVVRYSAFLRIARNDSTAMFDLPLPAAELLLSGRTVPKEPPPPPPSTSDLEPEQAKESGDRDTPSGGTESPELEGDTRSPIPSLDLAAVQLTADRREDVIAELIEQIPEEDDGELEPLKGDGVKVEYRPDERAIALSLAAATDKRFGGVIRVEQRPVDVVLRELGAHITSLEPYDDVRLRTMSEYLRLAQDVISEFEGKALLDEFLDRRSHLLPHVRILSSSPLACLIADQEVRRQVRSVIEAYERLLSHVSEYYWRLHKESEGATKIIYRDLLALDMVTIFGKDSEARVAILPIQPLVLWKYAEIADLVLKRRGQLGEADLSILLEEVADLPEPLLVIHVLDDSGSKGSDFGFSDRIGSLPIYSPIVTEPADVSEQSLHTAARKLAALYPAVKSDLRILLFDPVSTHHVAKALQALMRPREGFEHATLVLCRTQSGGPLQIDPQDRSFHTLIEEGRITVEEIWVPRAQALTSYLESHPFHLVAVSGQTVKNLDRVLSEGTRLHPLSLPQKLHLDSILRRVSLRPRSIRPVEGSPSHPFGPYQSMLSDLLGEARVESSLRTSGPEAVAVDASWLPHTQFLVVAGDLPAAVMAEHPETVRLAQSIGADGGAVFTIYSERIVHGIDAMLRKLNYQPTASGLKRLLDQLDQVAGEGPLATITQKGDHGFSETALRGQLGLAVALDWYQQQAAPHHRTTLSLDSPLAHAWLRKRDDSKRTDLLGIRQAPDGSLCVDIIEVKSYQATKGQDITESHPAQQLRSIAAVLEAILTGQGDILNDRRRELLRLQVFREGLSNSVDTDPTWVETLNSILDGDQKVKPSLTLLELVFDQNIPPEDEILQGHSETGSGWQCPPVRRLRLGERDIAKHLQGVVLRVEHDSGLTSAGKPGLEQPKDDEPPPDTLDRDASPSPEVPPSPPRGAAALLKAESSEQNPPANSAVLGFELSPAEQKDMEETAGTIYRVLRDLGIRLRGSVDAGLVDIGPSVIRYKVHLHTGEKVSVLRSRSRDLMRELALEKEPIIDNLPNTNFVYIDLPRPHRRPAYLRSFLETLARPDSSRGLSVPAGVTPAGEVKWLDITALPHMLVAGSTGAGKTMFLYNLIVTLSHLYRPYEVHLVLIDPKQTDFVFFNDLPHLRGGHVITDPEEAVSRLMLLLTVEVQQRTRLLTEHGHRDIESYNARHADSPIPPIVVIIDEFADLADIMQGTQRDKFDLSLRRLAQRARNVGIHLVLATQRPTTDIVNGNLKNNLPCRVSFRLASQVDSRTILDRGGAEHLLGNGDMLLSWNGETTRLQGFYLPEDDIAALLGQH